MRELEIAFESHRSTRARWFGYGQRQDCFNYFFRSHVVGLNRSMCHAIKRQSAFISRGEVCLICEDRAGAFGAAAAGERGLQLNFEMNEQCAGGVQQEGARFFAFDRSSAEGEDEVLLAGESRDGGMFEFAKGSFATGCEDLGDIHPRIVFDDVIRINKSPPQSLGNQGSNRRLSGSHESGQDDANGRVYVAKAHALV